MSTTHGIEWVDARSVDEAVTLLNGQGAIAKAGGMDVLDWMKEGLLKPRRIVNLRTIAGLDGIHADDDSGLYLGASATLAHIAQHPAVRTRYAAIAAAAGFAATPQVRNVATIAGNLLQRPRCWYFRNELFANLPDRNVLARDGGSQYHAIFDNTRTAMTHASTPATALIAFDAVVHVASRKGSRETPLEHFLLAPDAKRSRDVKLGDDEIVTHLTVPSTVGTDTRSAYIKQTERDSYDWPICDVAALATLDNTRVTSAKIVMGWVAPTPRRAFDAEKLLIGQRIDEASAAAAARAAVADATPLAKNGYKVQVLEAVVKRVLLALVAE